MLRNIIISVSGICSVVLISFRISKIVSPTLVWLSAWKIPILTSETIVCSVTHAVTIITFNWLVEISKSRSGIRSWKWSESCVRKIIPGIGQRMRSRITWILSESLKCRSFQNWWSLSLSTLSVLWVSSYLISSHRRRGTLMNRCGRFWGSSLLMWSFVKLGMKVDKLRDIPSLPLCSHWSVVISLILNSIFSGIIILKICTWCSSG